MKKFLEDLKNISLSKLIIILSGLLSSIVTARLISPEGNGIIASLTAYPDLFVTLGSLGIGQSVTYYIGKKVYAEAKIKNSIFQIWIVTSIISSIICILINLNTVKLNNILIIISIMPIPFQLFISYSSGIYLGKGNIKGYNKINWVSSVINILCLLVLVIFLKLSIKGALISLIIGPLIVFIIIFKNEFKFNDIKISVQFNIIKQLIILGFIYAISLFIINFNYKISILMLNYIGDDFSTGIYSKGSSFVNYLWQIPNLLSTLIFSRSANSKNNNEFSIKITKLLRFSLIVVLLISIIILILTKGIVYILFGENYIRSINVIKILLPGVFLLTIFRVLNMDLAGRGKPWISLYSMVPSLILNIGLSLTLIPKYKEIGASISSTISYSISAIIFLIVYSKEVKIKIRNIILFQRSDIVTIKDIIKIFKSK